MSEINGHHFKPSFELFNPSVDVIKNNLLVYFVLAVLPILVWVLPYGVIGISEDTSELSPMFLVTGLIASIASLLIYPALTYTALRTSKGEKVQLNEAFREGYKKFWPLLGTAFLTGIIIFIGILAFIVPGIIMIRRYLLAPYYVLDRDMGITEAMKTSADESKQYSGTIYGILGVNVVFIIISVIPVIGQIIGTILQFLYSVAPALRYHEIKEASKA